MAEIRLKCPTCGKILLLADGPNIAKATFTCPICKEKHVVGTCKRISSSSPLTNNNQGEETRIGGNHYGDASNSEKTQIASDNDTCIVTSPQQSSKGYLMDEKGRSYRLRQGVNTIGRMASTSTATIQIDTDDRYMSRSHAIIEVSLVGGQCLHLLKNGANKNPSYLNGTLIKAGDQLVLNNGDSMIFGNTRLIFKK